MKILIYIEVINIDLRALVAYQKLNYVMMRKNYECHDNIVELLKIIKHQLIKISFTLENF